MTTKSEQEFINKCIAQIEQKLSWGASDNWTHYDFEKLSDIISDATQVVLSVTTLKRVWGKLKYPHAPSLTTLNTLAAYLGFEDWRTFKQRQDAAPQIISIEKPVKAPVKKVYSQYWYFAFIPVALITYFFVSGVRPGKKQIYDPNDFSFSANKVVGDGVPNSVVFSYDASKSKTDSVYIVQTWDIRRKTLVPKNGHAHSAIYYYPGYFRTKLIVDDQAVKTHDLQITSGGWLALVENENQPLYFKKEDYLKDSLVEIDENALRKYNLSLLPNTPKVRFFNQGDLGDLSDDNFQFETTLKNGFSTGSNACQYVEVLIQCKDDIIIIPLCAKACIGSANLYAAGKELNSKEADLSGFGADLNNWTTLKVESVNKQMTFYVNGNKAASFVFPNDPAGIVGVQYRFNGLGAVRDTWFSNKTKRIGLN